MIHWWWLIPAFAAGFVAAIVFVKWIEGNFIPPNWR